MATQPFSLADVYGSIESIKGARLNNQRRQQDVEEGNRRAQYDQLLIETGKQALDPQTGRYSAAAHARALDAAGYSQAGEALREKALAHMTKVQQYVQGVLPRLTPENYPAMIGDLVQQGILTEGSAPAQYDPAWVQQQVAGLNRDTAELQYDYGELARGPGGAIIYGERHRQTGKTSNVRTVTPPTPRAAGGGEQKPFQFKVGDSNAIYRQAAGLFGGMYDPITGRIAGLNKEQAANVQAIAALASRKYRESGGELDHASAVEEAVAEFRGAGPGAARGQPAASGAPAASRPPLGAFKR